MRMRRALALTAFAVALLLRRPFEADLVLHVLGQLPLLALAGALVARDFVDPGAEWNRGGVAALLAAGFLGAFWMLPRSIDAALSAPAMEAAKFAMLPALGLALATGWARAAPLLRAFLKAQAVSMCGVLAFLYIHAPVRLCNAYLVGDQERLGYAFLALAPALVVLWVAPLFSAASAIGLPQPGRMKEAKQ